jgi:deoxycytidylate deaminase
VDRTCDKLATFQQFAESLGELSTCRRAKVGTIIFPPDFTEVLAIGYNGQPRGASNDSCADVSGKCGCVHAEANALVKLATTRDGLVLLCTKLPCAHCAGLIANCRQIQTVLYSGDHHDRTGLQTLARAGKDVLCLDLEDEETQACRLLHQRRS